MQLIHVESMNRRFCVETHLSQLKPLYFLLSDPSHLLPSDTHIVPNLKLLFVFKVSSIVLAEHFDVCVLLL